MLLHSSLHFIPHSLLLFLFRLSFVIFPFLNFLFHSLIHASHPCFLPCLIFFFPPPLLPPSVLALIPSCSSFCLPLFLFLTCSFLLFHFLSTLSYIRCSLLSSSPAPPSSLLLLLLFAPLSLIQRGWWTQRLLKSGNNEIKETHPEQNTHSHFLPVKVMNFLCFNLPL